jgi:hypothetical protein
VLIGVAFGLGGLVLGGILGAVLYLLTVRSPGLPAGPPSR